MKIDKKIITAAVSGILAMILAMLFLGMKEREIAGTGARKDVLVAASDIAAYSLLEPGLMRFRKIPLTFVQPDAVSDLRETAGRVATAPIKKGEQILASKLVMGGGLAGLSFKIRENMRAVSIELSDSGAAGGLIRPDDHVDVLVAFDGGDSGDAAARILFQNVLVLAVNSDTHSVRTPEGVVVVEKKSNEFFGGAPSASSQKTGKNVITLALPAADAGKLILANNAGRVSLILRRPADNAVAEDTAPIRASAMGGSGFAKKDFREYRGNR